MVQRTLNASTCFWRSRNADWISPSAEAAEEDETGRSRGYERDAWSVADQRSVFAKSLTSWSRIS